MVEMLCCLQGSLTLFKDVLRGAGNSGAQSAGIGLFPVY